MKKCFGGFLFLLFFSCEENDIVPRPCLLASEQSNIFYSYNSKNEIVSYSSPSIFSSVLTYDDKGKIISELDNERFQISYSYDKNNRLILWMQNDLGYISSSTQIKFFYNEIDQDTLIQYYTYDAPSSSYHLNHFIRLSYTSSSKNYAERKTFNPNGTLAYSEKYQWDNHPNPYLSNPFFSNEPPPSNNILQYIYEAPGATPNVTDIEYDYNSNGFPLKQSVKGSGVVTNIYSYSNCK
jgi:YD repeat-containing protein